MLVTAIWSKVGRAEGGLVTATPSLELDEVWKNLFLDVFC